MQECFSNRKKLWQDKYNAFHLQGDGKWSVHGSPCDANHATFRNCCDPLEDMIFGFHIDPFKRAKIQDVLQDSIGDAPRDCNSLNDSILVRLWAHRQLLLSVRIWAWTSRGYFSHAEMADMNNLNTDEIKRFEAETKTVNEQLTELDCMPEVQPYPSKAINFANFKA